MKKKTVSLTLGLSGAALAAALVLPALAQESLLPEGFGNPADTPVPAPRPSPTPSPTPAPASTPRAGSPAPSVTPTTGSAGTSVATAAAADEEGEVGEEVAPGTLINDFPP